MVESEPVENVDEENREEEEKENREEEKEIRILGLKVLAVIREAQQKHGLRSVIISSDLKDLTSKKFYGEQCCGSGINIPDPGSDFLPSRIRTVSIPDPHQRI